MSSKDYPADLPSDDEDDAENIEIDLNNSVWELDLTYEFDAPQWFDFTNVDEVFISDDAAGGDHSWFMHTKPGHEPPKPFWMTPTPTAAASAPSSPRTPNGKSRVGPLGISHLGSPMRVATAPQSPAPSSPRSPNVRTPTGSPKAPVPVSRFVQQAAASPKALQSPQRVLLGSPTRVASPVQPDSPGAGHAEPRGRNLLKSFSVTFMNAMAAKEAKMSSPAAAAPTASAPPASLSVPVPAALPIPVAISSSITPAPSLADLDLEFSDTDESTSSNPAGLTDLDSDGDDSFPSPPPVPSKLLTSFLMRAKAISPTSSSQNDGPQTTSPVVQTVVEPQLAGPLGRLGAPMRVQKADLVPSSDEIQDDPEFDEPPVPKLQSSVAQARPVALKATNPTARVAVASKNPIKLAGKPPAVASVAPANTKIGGPIRAAPVQEKPVPKPAPLPASVASKQKPGAMGQAARKQHPTSLPPQPPKQPSTITKRKAKVLYTPASSAAQEENLENLADPWISQPKSAAPVRKFGKLGVEVDESVIQMVREHNKKFAPKPTYEPRKFSLHEIRAWERQTGQQWYALSPSSREKANEQIAAMQSAASQL